MELMFESAQLLVTLHAYLGFSLFFKRYLDCLLVGCFQLCMVKGGGNCVLCQVFTMDMVFWRGVLFMYIWNPIQCEQISNIFMFGGLSPRCGCRVSSFYFVVHIFMFVILLVSIVLGANLMMQDIWSYWIGNLVEFNSWKILVTWVI